MGYSYKSYSDTKEVFKKFVNAAEGQAVYGISRSQGLSSKVCKFSFTPLYYAV